MLKSQKQPMTQNYKKNKARGRSYLLKNIDQYTSWTRWFAWYPVIASGRLTWLKTIYRKYDIHFNTAHWVYKTLEDEVRGNERIRQFNKNKHNKG